MGVQWQVNRCMEELQPMFDGDGAWLWLHLPQPLLAGDIPRDLIARGELDKVMQVIRQLRDGVHV